VKQFFAACSVAIILVACGQGGFQRGVFYGKVIDRTPDEVAGTFGKPDEVTPAVADGLRYVYVKKTFNPDNQNQVDDKTIVEFAKDKDGKTVYIDVSYM
jgi:hypothetical protein